MTAATLPPQGPRDRRARNRRALIDAARALLDEGTRYTELSVQRICRRAGVGRTAFYQCFRDKTALLIAMHAELAQVMMAAGSEALTAAPDTVQTSIRTLEALVAMMRADAGTVVAMAEVAGYSTEVRRAYRSVMRDCTETVAALLATADGGHGPASPHTLRTARALTSMIERTVLHQIRAGDRAEDRRLARALGRAAWLMMQGSAAQREGA